MKIHLLKTLTGLSPADQEAEEFLKKKKLGSVLSADIKEVRNYAFHKKLFALLSLGFEYFEPGGVSAKHGIPEKNFTRFRKDVIILAGYHHTVIRLDGSTRVEADSISFAKMEQDVFDGLFNRVLDVLVNRIPMLQKMGAEETNRAVDKLLEFA